MSSAALAACQGNSSRSEHLRGVALPVPSARVRVTKSCCNMYRQYVYRLARPARRRIPLGASHEAHRGERGCRAEERRGGEVWVSACRSWWSPLHSKKKL